MAVQSREGETQAARHARAALAVMRAKGFADDAELRKAVAYRIVQALRLQAKRGTIGDAGMRKVVRVWAVES